MLLNKAYKSLNKNGACIIYEWFIDNERKEDTGAFMMSINMLFNSDKGHEVTQK